MHATPEGGPKHITFLGAFAHADDIRTVSTNPADPETQLHLV